MKTKPSKNPNSNYSSPASSRHDARIDAALRVYARAVPTPGLESRVSAHMAAAPERSFQVVRRLRLVILQRVSVGTLAAAAACALVVGTVQHSHHVLPPVGLSRPGGGVGSAGMIHVPTQAMPQSAKIDPASPRRAPHSRATLTHPRGRHANGVAVPPSPYPAGADAAASPR
jgi:hypothetical protein